MEIIVNPKALGKILSWRLSSIPRLSVRSYHGDYRQS
jgi:hypothetical protein